jgi:Flp pilus assembly protein CpaB
MTYQLRNVLVAIVLGLVAAGLTAAYVANYRKNVQHEQQQIGVLVAANDIPSGTTGAQIIAGHMLKRESVPRTALVPGAISSPDEISRLVTTDKVMAGEQVSTRRFGSAQELGIRSQLKGTLRAIQIAAKPDQVLAGTLRNGDHVDVVANLKVDTNTSTGGANHFDRVFLRDLLVLKAPSVDAGKNGALGSQQQTSITLAVTDSQASKLMFVVKNADANSSPDGGWALQLRPVANAADSPENIESIDTVLLDGLSRSERARVIGGH